MNLYWMIRAPGAVPFCTGCGGFVVLIVGAQALLVGAVTVAEVAGLSTAVMGLTVVAVGTSLSELATSVVAPSEATARLLSVTLWGRTSSI